jgi:hypothetical protein
MADSTRVFLLANMALSFYLVGPSGRTKLIFSDRGNSLTQRIFMMFNRSIGALKTHWVRTMLINAYAFVLLAWAIKLFGRVD